MSLQMTRTIPQDSYALLHNPFKNCLKCHQIFGGTTEGCINLCFKDDIKKNNFILIPGKAGNMLKESE